MAAVLVFGVACGGSQAAKPAQPTSTYQQLEARLETVEAALGRLAESVRAATDCANLAHALRAFSSAHASELSELDALRSRLTAEERERFEYEHVDDRMQVTGTVRTAAAACRGDSEVRAALVTAGFR